MIPRIEHMLKYFFRSSVILMLILVQQNASGQQTPKSGQPETAEETLIYKECEGEDLRLVILKPESSEVSERHPAIVFFFGGGWVGGSIKQFRTHAEYFRSRGMVAILADYRTRKSHATTPKECVADAKSAVRYLRANAEKLRIDPTRICAAGGSAGGHLAAATATLSKFDEPGEDTKVSAVPNALVLFNPVFDNGPNQWGHKKVKDYWNDISPAHNIREGMPPAIVFLGDQDKLISVATARKFKMKMEQVGARSDLHVYQDKGHGFFNFGRDKNRAFVDTVTKTDSFLVELGFLAGACNLEQFLKREKN